MGKDCWSKTRRLMQTKDLVGRVGLGNGEGIKQKGKQQRSAMRFRGGWGTTFLLLSCFQNVSKNACQLPLKTSEEEILEERG